MEVNSLRSWELKWTLVCQRLLPFYSFTFLPSPLGEGWGRGSYQFQQSVNGFFFGDIFQDTFLASIEGYFSSSGTDIAVVGIGHLAWSIDDTSHDTDFQSHKMLGGFLVRIPPEPKPF